MQCFSVITYLSYKLLKLFWLTIYILCHSLKNTSLFIFFNCHLSTDFDTMVFKILRLLDTDSFYNYCLIMVVLIKKEILYFAYDSIFIFSRKLQVALKRAGLRMLASAQNDTNLPSHMLIVSLLLT